MAEYARVGLDTARVEDIVAAAGVSWGTFFHYFPAKEDVLLDAAAEVCRAYARRPWLAGGGPATGRCWAGLRARWPMRPARSRRRPRCAAG